MVYKKPRKPIYDASTGEPPTEDEIARMKKQARNVIDYWLAASDRSSKELYDKVIKKGITDDVAREVLAVYAEKGYIDDRRYAESFVRSKMTYDRLGVRAIGYKLSQKGIDRDLIEEVLAEIDTDEQAENALELATKKARSNIRFEKQKRLQQIVRLLASKGYSDNIFGVAQEAIQIVDDEQSE